MKQLLFTLLLFTYGSLFSQTKLINYKSHSGSSKNFKKTLHSNFFDKGESNFGMAPQRYVRNSKLDTVILLSDKVAVMVTSESCHYEDFDGRDKSNAQLWSAGKDTVYDHEVFNSGKSVKEMKEIIKDNYFFTNSVDQIVFIGFDGEKIQKRVNTDSLQVKQPEEKLMDLKRKKAKPTLLPKTDSLFTLFLLSLISALFNGSF